MIYLSLCMPTNGISEWVFPALDAIYKQSVDNNLFEVIVTDNGNDSFFSKKMLEYVQKYSNLIYKKTEAYLFENQIEALRVANGEYLKFINHRAILEDGGLRWMIDLIKSNLSEKPVIFLSNGALKYIERQEYYDFDGFVKGMKHFASWTTGVGVWKSDFERIPSNKDYNKISPHSDVLFAERSKSKYIIDDKIWSHEIEACHSNKGRYDLYKAFGCEELAITLNLYIDGDITVQTFKYVKKAYQKCVMDLYLRFSILKEPCSYILNGFEDSMDIFFPKWKIILGAYMRMPRRLIEKMYYRLGNGCKKE